MSNNSQFSTAFAAIVTLLVATSALPIGVVAAPGVSALGSASAGITAQTDAPTGMDAVADDRVSDAPLVNERANPGIRATDLHGSVYVSKHATTTSVTLMTPDQAQERAGPDVALNSEVAIVISDYSHEDGRTVSLPAGPIRDVVGSIPSKVQVSNSETGESWIQDTTVQDGQIEFYVDHFSENTVSFVGQTQITANPAADGTQSTYSIANLSSVSGFDINVTGEIATEWDNRSWTGAVSGDSFPLDVAGNMDPAGPSSSDEPVAEFGGSSTTTSESVSGSALSDGSTSTVSVGGDTSPTGPSSNNEPEFVFEGNAESTQNDQSGSVSAGNTDSITTNGNLDPTGPANGEPELSVTAYGETNTDFSTEYTERGLNYADASFGLSNTPGRVDKLRFYVTEVNDPKGSADIRIADGPADVTVGEGTLVKSGYQLPTSAGWHTINLDTPYTGGSSSIEVEFNNMDSSGQIRLRFDDGAGSSWTGGSGGATDEAAEIEAISNPVDVSVSSDSGASASLGDFSDGQTKTQAIDLSASASSLSFSSSQSVGTFDYSLTKSDRTSTEDPGADIDSDGSNEVSYSGVLGPGETATLEVPELQDGENNVVWDTKVGTLDYTINYERVDWTTNPGIDIDGDGTFEATVSDTFGPGETRTAEVAGLDTLTSSIDVTTASGSAPTNVSLKFQERTVTDSPSVYVNGHETGYAGTLSDGTTESLQTDTEWIQEGSNNVTVRVGGSTLSSDAPAPVVGLDYSHASETSQNVTYQSEKWSVRYSVAKQFASDRSGVSLKVPFDSRVWSVRGVEKRENSGSWSNVGQSDYSITDNTLDVEVGDVSTGDTVEIRANGSRVQTHNLDLAIQDPTSSGDLSTTVEFTSVGQNPYIGVSESGSGSWLTYLSNASYGNEDSFTRFFADGTQRVHVPHADPSDVATFETHDTKVIPETGDVDVDVIDAGKEPTLDLSQGTVSNDDVTIEYYNTQSGEKYVLYANDRDVVLDSETADSPVTLVASDTAGSVSIFRDSGGGVAVGGSSSSSGAIPVVSGAAERTDLPPILFIGLAVAIIAGAWYVGVRMPGSQNWFGIFVVPVVLLLTAEALGVPAISRITEAVASGLQSVIAPIAILAALLALYGIYVRWIKDAATPENRIVLRGDAK